LVDPTKVSGNGGCPISGRRRSGIQAGTTSSTPQAIAPAIARFIRFTYEDLTEKFIRFILEEFVLAGNLAEQVLGINSWRLRDQFMSVPATYLPSTAFENLTERSIRHVLEPFARAGNITQPAMG
jgi:hypothetical protein